MNRTLLLILFFSFSCISKAEIPKPFTIGCIKASEVAFSALKPYYENHEIHSVDIYNKIAQDFDTNIYCTKGDDRFVIIIQSKYIRAHEDSALFFITTKPLKVESWHFMM